MTERYKRYLLIGNEAISKGTRWRYKIQRSETQSSSCRDEVIEEPIFNETESRNVAHATLSDNVINENTDYVSDPDSIRYDQDSISDEMINLLDEITKENNKTNDNPKNLEDYIRSAAFSEIVSNKVVATKGEIFLMVIKYSLKNALSVTAMTELFQLINTMFDEPILPNSRYISDKLLNSKSGTEFHAVCHNCSNYLGNFINLPQRKTCDNCQTDIDLSCSSNTSFFVLIDPSKQIADLLNIYQEYYKYVIKERCHERDYIKDVYDGIAYREFQNCLSPNDRYNYVSAVFNTDGAQKFKSSNYSIWPLYLMLNELPPQIRMNKLITCGLWFYKKKPEMPVFLNKFVKLVNTVTCNGIQCTITNEQRTLKLHILSCCVDSVARAPIQGIKQFNGNFGCSWCLHPGEYKEGSMRYPAVAVCSRTHNDTIKLMLEEDRENIIQGVKYASPLINFAFFDIIKGFTVDYLHCCLEGVAHQITSYYSSFLSDVQIRNIDEEMNKIAVPQQISRYCRPFSCLNEWKAREWENFVLYYSIPVFSYILNKPKFDHWLLFVKSFYILLKDKIHISELNHAKENLYNFVGNIESLFGIKAMTYNVHLLLHICDTVWNWGPLWANSTFSFESANHHLLQAIKCSKGVTHQIVRFVNINHNILLIEEFVNHRANDSVLGYCKDILLFRVQNIQRSHNIVYFGKGKYVDQSVSDLLELAENSTKVYTKIVKDTCLYESYMLPKTRSCNAFAKLKNGNFIRIINFIFDDKGNKEYTTCNRVYTNNYFSTQFHPLTLIEHIDNENNTFVLTADLDRVCVSINVFGKSYLCPVPNLLHY